MDILLKENYSKMSYPFASTNMNQKPTVDLTRAEVQVETIIQKHYELNWCGMWRQIVVKQACGSPVYKHIAARSHVFKVYRTARMVNRYLMASSATCISQHHEYQALQRPFPPLFLLFPLHYHYHHHLFFFF